MEVVGEFTGEREIIALRSGPSFNHEWATAEASGMNGQGLIHESFESCSLPGDRSGGRENLPSERCLHALGSFSHSRSSRVSIAKLGEIKYVFQK